MEKDILEISGFNVIKEQLKQYALSDAGRDLIEKEVPEICCEAWKKKRDMIINLRLTLPEDHSFPSVSFPEIRGHAAKASKEGAVLEAGELAEILLFLRSASVLKRFLFSLKNFETIGFFADYEEFADLRGDLSVYLKPDGELKENIKELADIKKRTASANKRLAAAVDGYFQDSRYRGWWQEEAALFRDGRTVLPLKSNFKGRIQGIIHSSSSRGTTLFIEPADLVERNNELMELEEEYRREVRKILKDLTLKTGSVSEGLVALSDKIAFFDSCRSRVMFAFSYGGIFPELSERGIELYGARHLLLGPKAVPIDIKAGEDIDILLISGPNTGGKTVALKTAALIVLMNQFCLGVPAIEGSRLAFFDSVLVDIGDGQSIEDSLSTFSAHMKNISRILREGTSRSLILLDEPGTGTDPDEGASIAMAVLDRIVEMGALALVTTHQSAIKNYAFTNKRAENISVKYDPETFTPEYKLIYGTSGESFGIDIAGRNGMPEEIIGKARKYLGSEKVNITLLLKQIAEKNAELEERERADRAREQDIKEAAREISLKKLQLRQKEYEIKKSESSSFSKLVSETGSRLENLVRELREGEITKEKTKEVKRFLDDLASEKKSLEEKTEILKRETAPADEEIDYSPGDHVWIGPNKREGTIIQEMKKGKYLVAAGQMRFVMDKSEFVLGKAEEKERPSVKAVLKGCRKPEFVLDIRGKRFNEAMDLLDRQMDSAILCGLSEFSVIHGKGEGILQKGVHDYLASNKNVISFDFAGPENGGFGKTVVKLG